jgi:hypothetical protein
MRMMVIYLLCMPAMAGNTTYQQHKAVHACVGMGVAWAGKELGYPKTGIALAWGLGIGKELYDADHGGSFRCGDICWTGIPATITFSIRW